MGANRKHSLKFQQQIGLLMRDSTVTTALLLFRLLQSSSKIAVSGKTYDLVCCLTWISKQPFSGNYSIKTLSLPDFCLKELRTIRFPAALMQIGGKEYNINLLKFQTPKMEVINIELLTALLARNQNYTQLVACLKQINDTCHLGLKYMKAQAILATAHRINTREQADKSPEQKETLEDQCINWSFGQFKIFLWVVLYQCLSHKIQIANIDQQIIHEMQSIFPLKSQTFIRYEIRLLNSCKKTQLGSWSKEETKVLEEVMESYMRDGRCSDGVNWRWVSYKIFTQSGSRFFRNLNHCREKWNNHLNPIVKRGHWSPEEDIRLFELVDEHGLRWSRISKLMDDTRTEHMVKNRYNRFMRIWKIGKNSAAISKGILMQKIQNYYGIQNNMRKQDCFGVKVEENSYEQESSQSVLKRSNEEQEKEEVRCKEEAVVKEEAICGGQLRTASGLKQSTNYFHPYYISAISAFTHPQMFPFIQ